MAVMECRPRASSAAFGRAVLLSLAMVAPVSSQVGGSVAGLVRDDARTPQMGAEVELVAPGGRVAVSVRSDYRGWFQFTDLFPGEYAVVVRQANFSTARRTGIRVQPGERTVLDVRLRGIMASLQLAYGSTVRDMSNDWRWYVRARHSRRNVLHFGAGERDEREEFLRNLGGHFEGTRAYAGFTAGRGNRTSGLRSHQDLGTAFAVATSLFGSHDVTVSGSPGMGRTDLSGGPRALRTTYARDVGLARPEVALTVRQMQVSSVATTGLMGSGAQQGGPGVPRLETFSIEFGDSIQVTDALRVEYGLLFETVKFADRLNVMSPRAQVVYEFASGRDLAVRYASGLPPSAGVADGPDSALVSNVRQLGMFPRVTLSAGRPTVQRSEHMEVAFREQFGNNLIEAAVYRDAIRDAAVVAADPDSLYGLRDSVPDLYASTSTLNGGDFGAAGVRVSYARKILEQLQAALGYGYGDVLSASGHELHSVRADELRARLESRRAHMLVASVTAELPWSGTGLNASYQWLSRASVVQADPFNDFASRSEPGLNVAFRQPLPIGGGWPGRFEASAEIRNLLKAGYVPLQVADGRMLTLLQAIRSYSGAVSYIF